MPTDPLTPQQLTALAPSQRFPKQRFLASPFEHDGPFAYYDLQTYLNKLSITGGSGVFLDFGHRFSTNPGFFLDLGKRF